MNKEPKILYGWKYETMSEKVRWFSRLSWTQRYKTMLSYLEFINFLKKKTPIKSDKRTFKTIQMLKCK